MEPPPIPPSVLRAMDELTNLGGEILTSASEQTDDDSIWARFFLLRCLDAFAAVRVLVEADLSVDAMAITRVLYEVMITFLYIFEGAQDNDERRIRLLVWRRDGLREVLKRERHLSDLGLVATYDDRETSNWAIRTATTAVDKIDRDIAELGATVRRDPTLLDKTKAIGFEDTYAILFRQSSDALHTSPMLLGEYAVAGGRGGGRMGDYGPVMLIVASRTMARVCARVGSIVGDPRAEVSREYSEFFARVATD